jgi:hypothetical protein
MTATGTPAAGIAEDNDEGVSAADCAVVFEALRVEAELAPLLLERFDRRLWDEEDAWPSWLDESTDRRPSKPSPLGNSTKSPSLICPPSSS